MDLASIRGLFASGRLVDVALIVIALELVVLLVRPPRGLRPLDVVGQVLAGAFLMLALRLTVTGQDVRWILLALTASFPAHVFDLVRRARAARA